jgi:CheY-like chemotaxis protein
LARKILLADDSVTAQNMGRKILADAGYEVHTVNNGSAALKKIAELKPDLVVLDVYMPGYSGLEVCQRLKEVHDTARTPVLLTVGKLEPFKPEEAKRVGAEGFIVKPFEASELLSALSKLEDKIVPRSEPSKPGRFARANAAVEESNRLQRDEGTDENAGWKKRISFPSKKKDTTPEDRDDPAIYNAKNRGPQSVAKREKPAREQGANTPYAESPTPEESRVDVAALATSGLPSDVSPEEIAAIAAAASQVQAVASASESPTGSSEERTPATAGSATEVVAKAATPIDENIEASPEPGHNESDTPSRPHAEVIAAIAALEPANGGTWDLHGSKTDEQRDVPATMAARSSMGDSSADSRWVAIPVALVDNEATVSLELEMQKAYAAFAAAEANLPGFVSSAGAIESSSEISSLIPHSEAQVDARDTSRLEPELPSTVTAVANASADAVTAAAEKLAAVAGSYVESEPAPLQAEGVQAQGEALGEATAIQSENPTVQDLPNPDSLKQDSPKQDSSNQDGAKYETAQSPREEIPVAPEPVSAASPEEPQSAAVPVSVDAEITAVTAEPTEAEAGNMSEKKESVEKESDLTATTAAAWANWRQIRSGDPKDKVSATPHAGGEEEVEPIRAEAAAMAVAAGAEKSAEIAAASESDPAIASIVDSMLADLRPKIVEEISRKLGKKK